MLNFIFLILFVILASGLWSCIESALVSLPMLRVKQLVKDNVPGANALLALKQNPGKPTLTIVVFNNFFNIVGSIFVGHHGSELFGDQYLPYISGCFLALMIVFSEIIPKRIGQSCRESISLRFSKILGIVSPLVTYTFGIVINAIESVFFGFLGLFYIRLRQPKANIPTEGDVLFFLKEAHDAGRIEDDEYIMIRRVFQLNDKTAGDIMVKEESVTTLVIDDKLKDCQDMLAKTNHSRIPVKIDKNSFGIVGIALVDDMLRALVSGDLEIEIREFARQHICVDAGTRADKLLDIFREKKQHMAVVMYDGDQVGIVTLEDVIEELTGEIYDETDVAA